LTLLDEFEDGKAHGVSDLGRQLGMHPATVHRMLAAMAERGYLRQESSQSQYLLGPRLIQLGVAASDAMDLSASAKSELESLVRMVGETAHLLVRHGAAGLYLDKVESPRPFRMPSQVGRRTELHSTAVGKAILAFLPIDEVDRIATASGLPRFTNRTITTRIGLRRVLVQVRQTGYAVDDEETEVGLRCVGAPIFDAAGQVIAGISIAGPAARVSPDRDAEHGQYVRAAALAISERLGYRLEMHAAERPVPERSTGEAPSAETTERASLRG
jgi:IclR family acetate operon transcriptional repressor